MGLCEELHNPVTAQGLVAVHKLQVHILGRNGRLAAQLKRTRKNKPFHAVHSSLVHFGSVQGGVLLFRHSAQRHPCTQQQINTHLPNSTPTPIHPKTHKNTLTSMNPTAQQHPCTQQHTNTHPPQNTLTSMNPTAQRHPCTQQHSDIHEPNSTVTSMHPTAQQHPCTQQHSDIHAPNSTATSMHPTAQ